MKRGAIALLLLLAAASARADVDGDLARARTLERKGAWAEAQPILAGLAKANPKHGWVLTELALAELKLGHLDAAVAAGRQALDAAPSDHVPAAQYNLSLALEAKGDKQGASDVFPYGFQTAGIRDRLAALHPPGPQAPAVTGTATAVKSLRAFCKRTLAESRAGEEKPGPDEGPASFDCGVYEVEHAGKVRSPVEGKLGKITVVFVSSEREYKGYQTGDSAISLLREAGATVELVPLTTVSWSKGGASSLSKIGWVRQADGVLLLTATLGEGTDYDDPTSARGSFEAEDDVVWRVGLDGSGHLGAFGPIPVAHREKAEPGFEDEGGTEIPTGKPWKQDWRFTVRWDPDVVDVSGTVPIRDRHRLGHFPLPR